MNDYDILGVSPNDPIESITKKYKKLAFKWHPDRNINNKVKAEEKFKEISSSYNNIINNKSNPFSSFTGSPNGEFNLGNLFTKVNEFKKYFKDIDYEDLLHNVMDKINTFKHTNDKTEDLYINANIELFDIYNNINKKIEIDRLRKCNECKGLEYCSVCLSKKYISKKIKLSFDCKLKNIVFPKLSHHYINKTPGDIIININPKPHDCYNSLNYYDLLYNYKIDHICLNDLIDLEISFKHLDNKTYKFKIINPQLNYKYKIDNLGLLYNNDENKRGDLYILLINNNNNKKSYILV
tara:strand:+ start:1653 stop:2537 length:885 start_codon:yes stop_codon:yes gene_type:complete